MTFSDAGYLITLGGEHWLPLLIGLALLGFVLWLVGRDRGIRHRWLLGPFFLVLPVVIAWHQGERVQFTPEGIRDVRWFREVEFLPWRHVESGAVEIRRVDDGDGRMVERQMLVLKLKTGEDWFQDLDELPRAQAQRIGAFVNEKLRPK